MQQSCDETLSRATMTICSSRELIEGSRKLCKDAQRKLASSRQTIEESRASGEPAPRRPAFYPGALSR